MLKNDEYDIEIRRINENDISRGFQTDDEAFDAVNPSGTLKEFFNSEQIGFKVYILKRMKDDDVSGIVRLRNEFDEIKDMLARNYAKTPAIYFSRLGVKEKCVRLGNMLIEFFLHIAYEEFAKSESDTFYIYLKCQKHKIPLFAKRIPFDTIVSYEDKHWGQCVLMAGQIRERR